jgi:hypothetical protein
MTIHVDEITSEVTALTSDLPLTEAQLEKLVKLVMQRMRQKERGAQSQREATQVGRSVAPPMSPGE